jgi:hypothetical protein
MLAKTVRTEPEEKNHPFENTHTLKAHFPNSLKVVAINLTYTLLHSISKLVFLQNGQSASFF